MRSSTIIFFGLLFSLCLHANAAFASFHDDQIQNRPPASEIQEGGTFGEFEVGLPGIPAGQTIDQFVGDSKPIVKFINLAVNAVIAVLVIIGLITIVIAGYIYMTAAGDGAKVKLAKEMITAALAGIFLALVSVIILNTINRYLGSDAQEPDLGEASGGSGGNSGGGSGGGGSGGNGGGNTGGGGSGGGGSGGGGNGGGGNGGGGGGVTVGGSIFNDTPPRSTPQTASIIIEEHQYYLRSSDGIDKPVSLAEAISAAQGTTGDTNGIRMRIFRTETARAAAESNLTNGLNNAGLSQKWTMRQEFITRK